jgi:hypothetical protein
LVLLFLFSITPKRYLHDLVADHKDSCSYSHPKQASVSQKGVNCHADDLVVKSPFASAGSCCDVSLPHIYADFSLNNLVPVLYTCVEAKDSRGPPAVL